MKFKSSHISAVLAGDSRHPSVVAASEGKVLPQYSGDSGFNEERRNKTIRFNPDIGALEVPDEGSVLFCDRIIKDPID